MAVPFSLKRREPVLRLCQFGFRRRCPNDQFGAALFVGADARLSAIAFDGNLIEAVAILARLGLHRISALRALRVLGFRLLHAFGLLANLLRSEEHTSELQSLT